MLICHRIVYRPCVSLRGLPSLSLRRRSYWRQLLHINRKYPNFRNCSASSSLCSANLEKIDTPKPSLGNMTDNLPWGRRLIVCCDGTWQSSVSIKQSAPSNITKLCRLISRIGTDKDTGRNFHQIVYYDGGIGTGNVSKFDASRQGGTGAGLAENVIEAYNFLVLNYEPGDEIFCFGFSRGAYTARAVAGLVSDIGVVKPIHMAFFPDLYRTYMANDEGQDFRTSKGWKNFTEGKLSKKGEEMLAKGTHLDATDLKQLAEAWEIRPHQDLENVNPGSRKIKVVGVFDTVGSLGVPDMLGINLSRERTKYGFHNVRLTEQYEHAFHALALDERRKAFRPTLWYIPTEVVENPNRKTPELKQVWFPGVHINAGGGNDDIFTTMKADSENLSTATLCWMLQCISPYLAIDQEAFTEYLDQYERWLNRIRFACTYHHETFADKIRDCIPNVPFINPAPSELDPPKLDPPHAHTNFDFSWGTGPLVDSFSGMYHLNGTHERNPGHEKIESWCEKDKEYKWKALRSKGPTNEYIHPVVYYRSLVRGWDLHTPLRHKWHREHWRDVDGKERFWWWKDGDNKKEHALPEWAILSDDQGFNFERKWYERCTPSPKTKEKLATLKEFAGKDFLKTLDEKIDLGLAEEPPNQWP